MLPSFLEIWAASLEISVPIRFANLKSFLLNFLSRPFLFRESILSKPPLLINLILRKMAPLYTKNPYKNKGYKTVTQG